MDIILLEKIENLGNIGDQVKVKSGYGRNYLLPKGKATLATPENIAIFEGRRAELESKQAEELAEVKARAAQIEGLSVQIQASAGPEGKLFGSVGTIDIADACTAAGVNLERSEVRLPDGPIRSTGEHAVEVHLHSDVNVTISITVTADGEAPIDVEALEAAEAAEAEAAESSKDEPAAE